MSCHAQWSYNVFVILDVNVSLHLSRFSFNMSSSLQDEGNTAMHHAAKAVEDYSIDVFITFLTHGADYTIKNNEGKTCLELIGAESLRAHNPQILTAIKSNASLLEAYQKAYQEIVGTTEGTEGENDEQVRIIDKIICPSLTFCHYSFLSPYTFFVFIDSLIDYFVCEVVIK